MPHSNSSKQHCHHRQSCALELASALLLLVALQLSSVCIEALTLPSFHRDSHHGLTGNSRKSETQIHSSVGWAMDNAEASGGLWKICSDSNTKNNRQRGLFRNQSRQAEKLVPFGPVPHGGSLDDIALLPASFSDSGSVATAVLEQPRHPLAKVRSGVRGVRRQIVRTAMNLNVLRIGGARGTRWNGRRRDASNNAAAAVSLEVAISNQH